MIPGLVAHVWQSTVFAGAAGLLAVALRTNRAQVRYWVWFAASAKFLIPFSWLVAIGTLLPHPAAAPPVRTEWVAALREFSQPLTLPTVAPPGAVAASAPNHGYLTAAALALWACGFAAVAIAWWLRWRRVDALRRSARAVTIPTSLEIPVPVMSAPDLLEPGVFGVLRPVLLLPEGIRECFNQAQLDAILTHEISHVRRRDNLTATIHMAVQAIFWFHPLTWWIGARLVDERERACDEEVLRRGCHPAVYAGSILAICRLYLSSPLACLSGVTGSDLKRRIEAIMRNRMARRLSFGKKAALTALAAAAVTAPIVVGIANAPAMRAESTQSAAPAAASPAVKFEAASIKPSSRSRSPLNSVELGLLRSIARSSRGGRFNAPGAPLHLLIELAYNARDYQIAGEPFWADSDGYDVNAVAEGNATFEQMRPMLQSLLADRFQLTLHRETRELPVYELTAAKGGLKIALAKEGSCVNFDPNGPRLPLGSKICGGARIALLPSGMGSIEGFGVTMPKLVELLSDRIGRTVIDKTGFLGRFDFQLNFTPDEAVGVETGPSLPGPSIFAALQEQMGLRLQPVKGPVEVLVIDRVERPTEN